MDEPLKRTSRENGILVEYVGSVRLAIDGVKVERVLNMNLFGILTPPIPGG